VERVWVVGCGVVWKGCGWLGVVWCGKGVDVVCRCGCGCEGWV